jgi:hypothetical protein
MQTLTWTGLLLIAGTSLGCAAQDPDDVPTAVVRGEVRSERAAPPPGKNVELLYLNYSVYDDVPGWEEMNFAVRSQVEVSGSYPAAFQLDISDPPPDEALTDFTHGGTRPDERKIGFAVISASHECTSGSIVGAHGRCLFGSADEVAVVWVDGDIVPGTRSEAFVGAALTSGYHLLAFDVKGDAEMQACHQGGGEDPAACARSVITGTLPIDSELAVRLVDGPEDFLGEGAGGAAFFGELRHPDRFDFFIW